MAIAVFIALSLLLGAVASVIATKIGNLTWPRLISLVVGACIVAVPLTRALLDEADDARTPSARGAPSTTSTVGVPTSTPQTAPTPTTVRGVETKVVLADDFSEPALGGWPTEVEGVALARYSSGEYIVRAPPSSWTNLFPQGGGSRLKEVSAEVDARRVNRISAKFGVVCRHGGKEGPFYAAWIDGDGFFQIFHGSAETPIGNMVIGRDATAIAEPGQSLRVKLECMGGEGQAAVLKLSVNNRLVAEATDATGLSAGAVGLITGGFGTPGSDIAFDNFTATRAGG